MNKKLVTRAPSVHVWAEPSTYQPFRLSPMGAGGGQVGAVNVDQALDRLSIHAALASSSMPAGLLLQEAQGQQVLAMAGAMVAKLARSMARDGRAMSDATADDATGAGAAAVVAWRNGQACEGSDRGAAGVCWRAIVASVASDGLGTTVEAVGLPGDDGGAAWDNLVGSSLPLPSLVGDASRAERASRLLFERARAKRAGLLARRVEVIKARGGRGKRAEVIDKIHRAAVLLLHGESVDHAATAAGFKPSGRTRAGDRLMRAVRELGFRVQFNARMPEPKDRAGGGLCVPMSAATASAYDFQPSATLPLDDGRGGARWVARSARVKRAAKRATKLARARAAGAARAAGLAKRTARQTTLDRADRRVFKAAGLMASDNRPQSRTNGFWRGLARVWRDEIEVTRAERLAIAAAVVKASRAIAHPFRV